MLCSTKFRLLAALGITAVGFAGLTPARAQAQVTYHAYAPPLRWGPELPIRGHLSAATYYVKCESVGNVPTHIDILAEYIDERGQLVRRQFFGNVANFRTGNFVGQPKLRFRATPTGCQVKVSIGP